MDRLRNTASVCNFVGGERMAEIFLHSKCGMVPSVLVVIFMSVGDERMDAIYLHSHCGMVPSGPAPPLCLQDGRHGGLHHVRHANLL
jgi:hypothetical protein